jgi:hypothetical protein
MEDYSGQVRPRFWNWSDQLEVVEVVLGSSFCALALATVGAADELVMDSSGLRDGLLGAMSDSINMLLGEIW